MTCLANAKKLRLKMHWMTIVVVNVGKFIISLFAGMKLHKIIVLGIVIFVRRVGIGENGIVLIVIDALMGFHYLAKLVERSQGICFENLPFGANGN